MRREERFDNPRRDSGDKTEIPSGKAEMFRSITPLSGEPVYTGQNLFTVSGLNNIDFPSTTRAVSSSSVSSLSTFPLSDANANISDTGIQRSKDLRKAKITSKHSLRDSNIIRNDLSANDSNRFNSIDDKSDLYSTDRKRDGLRQSSPKSPKRITINSENMSNTARLSKTREGREQRNNTNEYNDSNLFPPSSGHSPERQAAIELF